MRLAALSGLTPREQDDRAPRADELEPGAFLAQRYRIIRKVGEGGVGVVYLANQETPVKRQVAVKVLPGELGGPRAEMRFESERNALSRMNHPWVASIYDAGRTRAGRLFVVMEYVDGEPIDTYCARHALTVRERAELFVKVCRGVHHAHQKGIIHRDLKPGNVLVAVREGIAVPKIIDFGIAKVSTPNDSPRATVAGFFVGTPEYMSPEQAGVGDGDVDTISDVYSLGVLLYELLTGLLPLTRDSDSTQITDWQRLLATTDPVRPSQRLSQALARREVAPTAVAPRDLVGDLDSIAMKALSRERDRRYSSASELAADVERHLAEEQILARPPSLGYRLVRYARRHSALVAGLGVLLGSAMVAAIVVSSLASDAAEQQRQAEAAQIRAESERDLARRQAVVATEMTARSNLASARVAFEVRDAFTAKRALDEIPESYRGWEWRWLRYEVDRSSATARVDPHDGPVRKLSALAADSVVVSGGDDGTLRLWNSTDLRPVARVQAYVGPVTGLAVGEHPTTPLAATTDDSTGLIMWDLRTMRPLWRLEGAVRICRESISLDGTRIAVTRNDKSVVIYETLTGAELDTVEVVESWVEVAGFLIGDRVFYDAGNFTVVFSPDGANRTAFPGRWPNSSPTRDRIVLKPWNQWHDRVVFDVVTSMEQGWVRGDHSIKTLHLAPGEGVVTSEQPTTVTIRGRLDRVPRPSYEGLVLDRTRAQHGPIGSETARQEGVILPGHRDIVTAIVFSSSGDAVFSAAANGSIKRWEASLLRTPYTALATNDAVFGSDIDPLAERVATTGWGAVKVWDTRTGRELFTNWWTRAYITGVSFSPDSKRVFAADWGGELAVFDASKGEILMRWPSVGTSVTEALWAHDGIYLGTRGGEVMRLDATTGAVIWRRLVHPGTPVLGLARTRPDSPFPNFLYSAGSLEDALPELSGNEHKRPSNDPFVRALDPMTGAEHHLLERTVGPFSALALSPDGRELAGGAEDGTVAIWSIATGRLRLRLPGVGGRIVALSWTPDQQRVVFAHVTGVVVVTDAKTLAPLLTLPGAPPGVRAMAATPDGRALIMSGQGAPLVAHEAEPRASPVERAYWQGLRVELDRILTRHPGVDSVLATQLSPVLRDLARARGDNPNHLNSHAWATVRYPGESSAAIAFARAQSEVAAGGWPIWQFENTRALARLRDGDLEGALASVERGIELQRQAGFTTHPSDWATAAMALVGLGRKDEARAMLARALVEAETPPWRGDSEVASIVGEARTMVAQELDATGQ
jgi:serine/threonine protein kinase/WD40 repeat protein